MLDHVHQKQTNEDDSSNLQMREGKKRQKESECSWKIHNKGLSRHSEQIIWSGDLTSGNPGIPPPTRTQDAECFKNLSIRVWYWLSMEGTVWRRQNTYRDTYTCWALTEREGTVIANTANNSEGLASNTNSLKNSSLSSISKDDPPLTVASLQSVKAGNDYFTFRHTRYRKSWQSNISSPEVPHNSLLTKTASNTSF